MTLNFQAIKQDYDLETTIIGYIGQPDKGDKWRCPFHREDGPSFGLYADGLRWHCFGCGADGDIFDFIRLYEQLANNGQAARKLAGDGYILDLGLSPAEKRAKLAELKVERERLQAERQAAKLAKEAEALGRLSNLESRVEWYHNQVDLARPYWHNQGLGDNLIKKYHLGYAPLCPCLYPDEERQASYVLPYYEQNKLVSIRHRLSRPNGHGKYRPEFAGLPPRLFNTDSLLIDDNEIPFSLLPPGEFIVVEGEIKSLVVSDRLGCPCIGLPGATSWRADWAHYFKDYKIAYWLPDPGLKAEVVHFVAEGLKGAGCRVIIGRLPVKPDDYWLLPGADTTRFLKYLERGRLYQ